MEPKNHSQQPVPLPANGELAGNVSGPSPVPPTDVLTVAAVAVELRQQSSAPARPHSDYDRHPVPAETEHADSRFKPNPNRAPA